MRSAVENEANKAPLGAPGVAVQPYLDRIRFLFNTSGLCAATGAAAADVLSPWATDGAGRPARSCFPPRKEEVTAERWINVYLSAA